ncbi:Vesicular glutamate transporter 2 [Armadillidium nasatum]|uniref:Vesicular glutamate transporter 2 n=1 Tax=Armadillidium nasatum TaxID=96803 RepID=A0A5N5T687_9CRUS|nr:Vesicular glutamate transporter 2 [Armadillidium nasatum]
MDINIYIGYIIYIVFNCISARMVLGILCSLGVMELYSTRTNFSIAIVSMVRIVSSSGTGNSTNTEVKTPYCLRIQNNTTKNDSPVKKKKELPPIAMTTTERGNILGGRLSELYGTKKGLCYPALHPLTGKWIPQDEVSRFIGNSFGTIFTLLICGSIISDLGWEAVFYISGALSLAWVILWTLLMHDTPAEHPRILEEEKRYIESSITSDNKKVQKLELIFDFQYI